MPRRVISTMTKFPAKGSLQLEAALCLRIAKEDFNRPDSRQSSLALVEFDGDFPILAEIGLAAGQTRLGEFESGNG